ncbi:MAG: hypothetical protein LKI53_08730 [Bacteroidales bacterium]|jgi:hypothetical protein|nr:hypothetical protein [Bacteroidales bacterium]
MEKWNDVYLRAGLSDNGDYPRTGSLCHCPDIIPSGIYPVDDPNQYFLIDNWDKDVGKDLVAKMQNYIYVRATNLAGKTQTGKLYLYYCKASLLLYPNFWQNNIIKVANGKDYFEFSVDNDGKVVSSDEDQGTFIWSPEMISNDHYCLIGRVVTPDHPNPIPDVGDIDDFAKFIANNPNYGQRNVTIVDKDTPDVSIPVEYAQGKLGGEMRIILTCKELPVGSAVAFTCPTPGPKPLINLVKTTIDNPESEILGVVSEIPANWEGVITYHYWSNGYKPLKGFNITLDVIYLVNPDHELYKNACDPSAFLPKDMCNSIGPKRAIVLGSHSTWGK